MEYSKIQDLYYLGDREELTIFNCRSIKINIALVIKVRASTIKKKNGGTNYYYSICVV